MMKKKRKIKNTILKAMTFVMMIAAFTSAMTFRNVSWQAIAVNVISLAWVALVSIATEKLQEEGDAV